MPGGRLAGKHHRVGPVKDGIGDVTGFGARGARVVYHGLEHLRGGDGGYARAIARAEDALLMNRNLLGGGLYAQVAARHHHRVGDGQDVVKHGQRLGLFDLGDDGNVRAARNDQAAQLLHIGSAAHKR